MGLLTRARAPTCLDLGRAGRRPVRGPHDRGLRPVAARPRGSRPRSATSTPSGVLDRKDMRRTDRYIQFGLVVAREAMDQAGLPGALEGELAERTGVILGSGLGGVETLFDNVLVDGRARAGPDQPVLHPDGHRQRRRRPGRDQLRADRAELRDGVRLRDRRPRDRRGLGDDPARRRRHHDRRRRRGRRSTRRSSAGSPR